MCAAVTCSRGMPAQASCDLTIAAAARGHLARSPTGRGVHCPRHAALSRATRPSRCRAAAVCKTSSAVCAACKTAASATSLPFSASANRSRSVSSSRLVRTSTSKKSWRSWAAASLSSIGPFPFGVRSPFGRRQLLAGCQGPRFGRRELR